MCELLGLRGRRDQHRRREDGDDPLNSSGWFWGSNGDLLPHVIKDTFECRRCDEHSLPDSRRFVSRFGRIARRHDEYVGRSEYAPVPQHLVDHRQRLAPRCNDRAHHLHLREMRAGSLCRVSILMRLIARESFEGLPRKNGQGWQKQPETADRIRLYVAFPR